MAMDLQTIQTLSKTDMDKVNTLILEQLQSDVALINQIGHYIIAAGGKRMRPLLTVLAAKTLGYSGDEHIKLAVIIEFIHTSTLLHDDVVDESALRRGKETANALFGNAASVLVGDFLYSRSFQLMTQLQDLRVMEILADATNIIAEGEVLQLLNCQDPKTSEEQYLQVIYCKTAKLFEAATRLGAVLAKQPAHIELAMQNYGKYLGTAFQLVDDLLDYTADSNEIGKNVGDDLAEGKPTLPLIYAMHHGSPAQKELIRAVIENGDGRDQLKPVLAAMHETGALDYCLSAAEKEVEKAISALSVLEESKEKQALISLAHLAVNRTS